MPTLQVHMLPALMSGTELRETVVIVTDILRATTTLVHAFAHGAAAVIPCLSVEEAREQAERLSGEDVLLGGERLGQQIPGFDLDNSPFSYSPDVVAGRTIVFTTTNGTRALLACRDAEQVFLGAFVNRAAVVRETVSTGRDVQLVCAGTDGQLTAEDILFAGAIVADLLELPGSGYDVANVQAQMAADFYRARSESPETFRDAMFHSLGGTRLQQLGMQRDIERALEQNLFDIVPAWDAETGRIS